MKAFLKLYFWVGSIWSISSTCFSAGAPSFGYEAFEHENQNNPGLALKTYGNIQDRVLRGNIFQMPSSGAIMPGNNDNVNFGISPLGLVWTLQQHQFGNNLNDQEKAQLAVDRENIGIPVNFRFPVIIRALAGGGVVLGPGQQGYVNRAFAGGGYSSPEATMLHRLRYGFIPLVLFVDSSGQAAKFVILHIYVPSRVSKNMKELHCNSCIDPVASNQATLNPVWPAPLAGSYISIKSRIDRALTILGAPTPSSATVVSYDNISSN